MKKPKHRKNRRKDATNFLVIKKIGFWLAGLIVLVGLIYYGLYGVSSSSAFEQLANSANYYLVDQSGAPQTDRYGLYGVHYVQLGDTVDMWVTVKNMSRNPSAQVWYPVHGLASEGADYPNAHAIATTVASGTPPFWLDSTSFVANGNRFAYYDGPAVYKGKYMTLAWRVKVNSSAVIGSDYPLEINLVRELDGPGKRVTITGKNHIINKMRWVFRVSNFDVYNNPLVSRPGYTSGQLIYEDLTGGLTEKVMSYRLDSNQIQIIFQRTRADVYSPTISTQLADPYNGKLLIVQRNQGGDYGYGDKWLVDLNGGTINLAGPTSINILTDNNWWSALFSPDQLWVALERYAGSGVDLYSQDLSNFYSYFPRLNSSPWDPIQFYGYMRKAWDPSSSKLYLARCMAGVGLRATCTNGTARLEFDQLTIQSPDTNLQSAVVLDEQGFRTVAFDLDAGIAVGATSLVKNNIPRTPSEIRSVSLNSGAVRRVARTTTGVYQVKSVSADGSWFVYTMRHTTGSINEIKVPQDKLIAFVSRVGDIYQPILLTQDFSDIRVIGWSKDNRYIVFEELTNCTAEGCQIQLKVFDTQYRTTSVPALPFLSRVIAVF